MLLCAMPNYIAARFCVLVYSSTVVNFANFHRCGMTETKVNKFIKFTKAVCTQIKFIVCYALNVLLPTHEAYLQNVHSPYNTVLCIFP